MPFLALLAELTPLWGAIVLSAGGYAWAKNLKAHVHDHD